MIVKKLARNIRSIFKPKIFCISMQRTGTTSVGQFFRDFNYSVATWDVSRQNDWTLKWFKGDYESIFKSNGFKFHQVFEDDPWFCLNFYKVLFHRFPDSKFILLEREPNKWFDSMLRHSNKKTLGNTYFHSILYQRLEEFYRNGLNKKDLYTSTIDNLLPLDESHREHYINIYRLRNKEVKTFFKLFGEDRIVSAQLEDKEKWEKIGKYFNIEVPSLYEVHANKSK